jgi:hypothetical protein
VIDGMIDKEHRIRGRKVEMLQGKPKANAVMPTGVGRNVGEQSGASNKMPANPHGTSKETIEPVTPEKSS